jgi:hypothetical protein
VPGSSWLPPEAPMVDSGGGPLSGAPVMPGALATGAPAAQPPAAPAPDAPTAVNPVIGAAPPAPPAFPDVPTAVTPDLPPTVAAPASAPAPSVGAPVFLSPTNQAHVDTNQPFRWNAVPGATEYCVTVGIAKGADDLVNSGPLPPNQTTFQVPSLPAGRQLWARIYSSVNGHWSHSDVSFTAAPNQAEFQWPANGQSQVALDRPFTWSRVPWATNYWLTVGTAPGGSDLLNTGALPPGQGSYGPIPPMPSGVTLYARLLTNDGSNWTYVDVIFMAAPSPTPDAS